MTAQVERVHAAVPGAEVVDAVADDRGRLDRRAGPVAPAEPAARAVEHEDVPLHRVVDDPAADDRRRGGHLPVRRVVAPEHGSRGRLDRADGRSGVSDVGDAAVDGRRELDQLVKVPRPHRPERRPQPDVRLRLRA